jgi:hypothetical protein
MKGAARATEVGCSHRKADLLPAYRRVFPYYDASISTTFVGA